jgi:hypothetical protein
MEGEIARYFRDQFRQARARALQDAEGFQDTIFVLERFGVYLTGRTLDLGKYKKGIEHQAIKSPLADDIPDQHATWHSKFATIYETVRNARNDALHQGAFASPSDQQCHTVSACIGGCTDEQWKYHWRIHGKGTNLRVVLAATELCSATNVEKLFHLLANIIR